MIIKMSEKGGFRSDILQSEKFNYSHTLILNVSCCTTSWLFLTASSIRLICMLASILTVKVANPEYVVADIH